LNKSGHQRRGGLRSPPVALRWVYRLGPGDIGQRLARCEPDKGRVPLVRGQLILWVRRPMARSSRRRWIGPTRARRGSIRGRARLAALILNGTSHRSRNGCGGGRTIAPWKSSTATRQSWTRARSSSWRGSESDLDDEKYRLASTGGSKLRKIFRFRGLAPLTRIRCLVFHGE
jgi:hypothetical protein